MNRYPDPQPLPCGHPDSNAVLVEYHGMDPNHIDGWSEIHCQKCSRRWGRWTGKELASGESEVRYGGKP